MLLIDGHLDLAWNALALDRDLTRSVFEIRRQEIGMPGPCRAAGTVAFPEMRKGEVAVCLAAILPRILENGNFKGYRTPEIAGAVGRGQLAYYQILERQGHVRIIKNLETLDAHMRQWQKPPSKTIPLGFIISMEGADAIIEPEDLKYWWSEGLRVLSVVHFGANAYAHGTGAKGGLTPKGRELLEEMDSLGVILDVTHLSDESFWETLDIFGGPALASHNNCRALVPGGRQFSDEQIKVLIKRDAVIGVALDAWMLYPNWVSGQTPNTVVSLEAVADHVDHMCRLAGNSRNVGIGSDLDGGFGREQCPHDLDTIADLQEIGVILKKRGYTPEDVESIMHRNWLQLFRRAWSGTEWNHQR